MSDYHLHLHPHGRDFEWPPLGEYPDGLIESYVDLGFSRGITELGFTEHLYRTEEGAKVLGNFWEKEPREDLRNHTEQMMAEDAGLSLPRYVDAVLAAKEQGMPVKLGLEVDFFPQTIEAVLALLEPYPFDFLIGSVHWVGGWSIDSSSVTYEFERRGITQSWDDYFALAVDLAGRGVVDVLAHIDLCKKFGHRPDPEPVDLYQRVAKAAARSGTAVEVSSQGLRYPIEEAYPSPAFLEIFHEAGVEITFASDAHDAQTVGFAHEQLVELAQAAGYRERLSFSARRRRTVPLT